MKKITILIILLLLGYSTLHAQTVPHKWVLFGEHPEKVSFNLEEEFHIHMDQNGDFYPNKKISDNDLKSKGNSELKIWAQEYPNDFEAIAKSYKLNKTNYSVENYNTLQDSIIATIAKTINHFSNGKSQTWLIHGFRKNLYQPENYVDLTSLEDNSSVKNRINNYLNEHAKKKTYFIEVYWDGRYMFFRKKHAFKLAEMFKKAIPNAEACGYSLRDLFHKMDSNNINIITHSTGTHVGTNLLFNVDKKFKYTKPTPDNTINLILVASASAGKKLFKKYYSRNTTVNFKEKDNYTIINAFNKKDNALRLNLLYPARASTKLGCDCRNESGKLLKYFNKNYVNSNYVERKIEYDKFSPHFFDHYVNHSSFNSVLSIIYN